MLSPRLGRIRDYLVAIGAGKRTERHTALLEELSDVDVLLSALYKSSTDKFAADLRLARSTRRSRAPKKKAPKSVKAHYSRKASSSPNVLGSAPSRCPICGK